MADIYEVIKLYKYHSKYEHLSDDDIYYNILPSIKLKQYCIHENEHGLYGFSNWAFLNQEEEKHLLKYKTIRDSQWCSGDIAWHMDIVSYGNTKEIMKWTKQYFTKLLGVNKKVKWFRIYNDKIILKEILTKECFNGSNS